MQKTLYVTDLDGTLLSSDIELSDRTIKIINGLIAKGINFTCATGRSRSSAKRFFDKLDLKLPVVTDNGAILSDPKSGEILNVCVIDTEKIKPIIKALEQKDIRPKVNAIIDGVERKTYFFDNENIDPNKTNNSSDPRLRIVHSYDDLFAGDIFAMTFIGSKQEILSLEPLIKSNPHICYHLAEDIYNIGEYWLDIGGTESTKAHGVEKLKKFCNTNKLVVFGDHLNDQSMFDISDECYAPQNAHMQLKQKATGVIASNNDDGVALWLEQNVKLGG